MEGLLIPAFGYKSYVNIDRYHGLIRCFTVTDAALEAAGRRSMIHFRKPKGKPMPEHHRRANRARSAIRSAVEHIFADQKTHMGLFARTIGLARATVKIGMASLAHNFRRLMTIYARSVPA